jgi:protein disulfide-isomerase A1
MRYSVPICGLLASMALASDVVQLKKDDFKGFMEEHDLVLAECRFLRAPRSLYPSAQS